MPIEKTFRQSKPRKFQYPKTSFNIKYYHSTEKLPMSEIKEKHWPILQNKWNDIKSIRNHSNSII